MRIRAVVTVALAALAVAVLTAMPAFAAKGGTDRPIKISGNQTGTITFSGADCFVDEPPPTCIVSYELLGPAIGSHLGKTSVWTGNDGSGPETNINTAANGDTLISRGVPGPTPVGDCPVVPGFGFSEPYTTLITYTGGTGRFATASGTATSVGCIYIDTANPDLSGFPAFTFPFYITFTETGTISY